MTQNVLLNITITELLYICNMRFKITCRVASVERSLSVFFFFVAKVVCENYKVVLILWEVAIWKIVSLSQLKLREIQYAES